MSKSEYIKRLLTGTHYDPRLTEAVLLYWHSGIPIEAAEGYFNTLKEKLNAPMRLQESYGKGAGYESSRVQARGAYTR